MHDRNATQFLDELLRLEIARQEERQMETPRHASGFAIAKGYCCKLLWALERRKFVWRWANEQLKMASVYASLVSMS